MGSVVRGGKEIKINRKSVGRLGTGAGRSARLGAEQAAWVQACMRPCADWTSEAPSPQQPAGSGTPPGQHVQRSCTPPPCPRPLAEERKGRRGCPVCDPCAGCWGRSAKERTLLCFMFLIVWRGTVQANSELGRRDLSTADQRNTQRSATSRGMSAVSGAPPKTVGRTEEGTEGPG